jgi:hypothetical protein
MATMIRLIALIFSITSFGLTDRLNCRVLDPSKTVTHLFMQILPNGLLFFAQSKWTIVSQRCSKNGFMN